MSLAPRYLPLLALIPLMAGTDLLVKALTLASVALLLLPLCGLLLAALDRVLPSTSRPLAALLLGAGLIGLIELLLQWLSAELYAALGPLLPLLILPCLFLGPRRDSGLRAGMVIAGLALGLGLLREPLGHASLLAHLDWLLGPQALSWSLSLPSLSGLAVVMLAPGGLLTLGLLWAAARHFFNLDDQP
jgi:electron transport complex protein RnfE